MRPCSVAAGNGGRVLATAMGVTIYQPESGLGVSTPSKATSTGVLVEDSQTDVIGDPTHVLMGSPTHVMRREGCSLSFALGPLYVRRMQAGAPNPALDRLEAVIADERTRTEWWRHRGLIDEPLDEGEEEDVAGVVTGLPEPSRIEQFFGRYHARQGAPLPRFYFELLSRFCGIASGPMPSGVSGPMASDEPR